MIHPELQGRDFLPLQTGDPIFLSHGLEVERFAAEATTTLTPILTLTLTHTQVERFAAEATTMPDTVAAPAAMKGTSSWRGGKLRAARTWPSCPERDAQGLRGRAQSRACHDSQSERPPRWTDSTAIPWRPCADAIPL